MKYKPGDKVILLNDVCGYKTNDIGFIIRDELSGYVINIPNRISTSPGYKPYVYFNIDDIEYYYEKPLQNLLEKIVINNHISNYVIDYHKIKSFIRSNETLTKEDLIICQNMWEKYNK